MNVIFDEVLAFFEIESKWIGESDAFLHLFGAWATQRRGEGLGTIAISENQSFLSILKIFFKKCGPIIVHTCTFKKQFFCRSLGFAMRFV